MTIEPVSDGPYRSLVKGDCGCTVLRSTGAPDGNFSDVAHWVRGHEESCRVAT